MRGGASHVSPAACSITAGVYMYYDIIYVISKDSFIYKHNQPIKFGTLASQKHDNVNLNPLLMYKDKFVASNSN